MVNLLDFPVTPCWIPLPVATTLLGSQPSDTDTLKGLWGTGVSSYRTWMLWTPGHEQRGMRRYCTAGQSIRVSLWGLSTHSHTHTQWCTTILNGCVLHSVGSVGIVYDLTVSQSSRLVSDVSLYVVSSLTGQMLGIYCKLSGGFSVKS